MPPHTRLGFFRKKTQLRCSFMGVRWLCKTHRTRTACTLHACDTRVSPFPSSLPTPRQPPFLSASTLSVINRVARPAIGASFLIKYAITRGDIASQRPALISEVAAAGRSTSLALFHRASPLAASKQNPARFSLDNTQGRRRKRV